MKYAENSYLLAPNSLKESGDEGQFTKYFFAGNYMKCPELHKNLIFASLDLFTRKKLNQTGASFF